MCPQCVKLSESDNQCGGPAHPAPGWSQPALLYRSNLICFVFLNKNLNLNSLFKMNHQTYLSVIRHIYSQ